MAKISFREPKYSKITINTDASGAETETYGEVKTLSKAIRMNATFNSSDVPLYADDAIAEYVTEFLNGDLSFEGDDVEDSVLVDLLGITVGTDGETVQKDTDTANYVRLGAIVGRIKSNKRQYKAVIYTKVKFAIPADDYETKGESIVFKTTTISGKLMRNAKGEYRLTSGWKDTIEEAQTYLNTKLAPKGA